MLSDKVQKGGKKERIRTAGRSGYKARIFLLLFAISVIPSFSLGIYAYRTYIKEMTERLNNTMVTANIQVRSRMENLLTGLKQYYTETGMKDEIKWLMEEPSIHYYKYTELKSAQDVLRGPLYLDSYITGYSFLNLKEGWVLSNVGMFPIEEAKNYDSIREFLEEGSGQQIYWRNHLSEADDPVTRGKVVTLSGLMLVVKFPALAKEADAILVVNIRRNEIYKLISEGQSDMDVCVMDSGGELIYATDLGLYDAFLAEYGKDTDNFRDLTQVKTADGASHRVCVERGTENGMYYITSYPAAEAAEGAERIIQAAVIIIAILFVLLVVCYFLTGLLYRPIYKLTEYARGIFGEQEGGGDEFAYIVKGVDALTESKKDLEDIVARQRYLLIELFMVRLMQGGMTQEKIDSFVERYRLVRHECYAVIAVTCIIDNEVLSPGDPERDAVYYTIAENLPEEIVEELFVPPINHEEIILLVLGEDCEEALSDKIIKVHEKVAGFIEETLKCPAAAGASVPFHRLKHFRTAVNESIEALRNEGVGTEEEESRQTSLIYYGRIARENTLRHGYDLTLEREIRDAVDNCDRETANASVDEFVDSIHKKGASRHERSFYLHRFLIAALVVPANAGLSMNQIFGGRTEDIFKAFDSIYDADKLKSFYKNQIIGPIIEALTDFRKSPTGLREKITALVKEAKGDITLTECAERLNYHPSYIWKVLKSELGMTFTDFANLEKLEAAKELLVHTDQSVGEIAEKLNYANAQNFIRFFSKYENTTPGKYRKEKKMS